MQNHPAIKSNTHKALLICVLLLMGPVSGMAVDLIAPSLPAIARSLNVSPGLAKSVITIYLVGYAIGSFIIGFLTDAYGRKHLLRTSIFGFVLVSLFPVLIPDEHVLLTARMLQGLFLGCQSGISRATISDVLSPIELKKIGVIMGTMWGLGPVIGPVLGGYLQHYFNWQAGFLFFAIVSFVVFAAIFIVMPETHLTPKPLKLKTALADMSEIIQHRAFVGLILMMGFVYALLIIFNTLGPFLIQNILGYSVIYYGRFALVLGVVYLLSTVICRWLLEKHEGEKLVESVSYLFAILLIISMVMSCFFSKNIYFVVIVSALAFFMAGFTFPLSMGLGIGMFQHIAGTASSVMFLFNVSITALVSFVCSFYHIDSAIPLVGIYLALQLLIVIVYCLMVRGRLIPGRKRE